jgi:hypothetical protein
MGESSEKKSDSFQKKLYIIGKSCIDHEVGGIFMKNTPLAGRIVFLLPLFFVFIACQNQPEDTINIEKSDYTLYQLGRLGLDEDTEWQILLSCQKKLKSSGKNVAINDIWIEKYYGPYCPYYRWDEWYDNWPLTNTGVIIDRDAFIAGWDIFEAENKTLVAVVIGVKGQDTEQRARIQQYHATPMVNNRDNIFLWDDGQLSTLKDGWYLLFSEDFLSITNQQNGLELEIQSRIQEDFGKYKPKPWSSPYKYLRIQYLGTYNAYIILTTHIKTNAALGQYTIGDVRFTGGPSGEDFFAWKDGEIFELTDLYEQGLITREDLIAMVYEFGGNIK